MGSGTAEDGKLYANVNVTGGNLGYMNTADLTILAGRSLSQVDQEKGKKVAVVSDYLVNNLFDGDTSAALGQTIEVTLNHNFYTYYIVGVYEYSAPVQGFPLILPRTFPRMFTFHWKQQNNKTIIVMGIHSLPL